MKKIIPILLLLTSCNHPKSEIRHETIKIDSFIAEFATKNPSLSNNDITLQSGNDLFIKELNNFMKTEGVLKGMKVEVGDMEESNLYNEDNAAIILTRSAWDAGNDLHIEARIGAIMDKDKAVQLKKGVKYRLGSYKMIKQVNGRTPQIIKSSISGDLEFHIGDYLIKLDSLIKYP